MIFGTVASLALRDDHNCKLSVRRNFPHGFHCRPGGLAILPIKRIPILMTITGANSHPDQQAANPAPHFADPDCISLVYGGWRTAPHQIIAHRQKAPDGHTAPYQSTLRRPHVLELINYEQQNAYRCCAPGRDASRRGARQQTRGF